MSVRGSEHQVRVLIGNMWIQHLSMRLDVEDRDVVDVIVSTFTINDIHILHLLKLIYLLVCVLYYG